MTDLRTVARSVSALALAAVAATAPGAEPDRSGVDPFSALGIERFDPAVPTLAEVVGHDWGERITDPEQLVRYGDALAAASPRVVAIEYGRSVEGRPLTALIVGEPGRLAELDRLQADLARLGDARVSTPEEAEDLLARLPAVVWIAGSVHGDEPSGADAALALVYALTAGTSPAVDEALASTVVVVDLVQNPDGRARFVQSTRAARGSAPASEPTGSP